MFTFLHAADVHLDSPLRGLEKYEGAPVAEVRGACRRAFDNLIDLAVEEEVSFLLLAGDLFDGGWKDYNTGLYFVKCMARLRKAGIPVFIVLGNHDAESRMTKSLRLPDNVTLFSSRKSHTILLEKFAVAIHGRSYPNRKVSDNLAATFPSHEPYCFNIGLLHTSLNGRPGHEPYAPCSLDDLAARGYDYWALGHIHQAEIVCENPHIIFPGCLQGRHIREEGPGGAVLVTVRDGKVVRVDQRCLDVMRWRTCRVDLSPCETLEAVYDQVQHVLHKEMERAEGRTLAVRLVLVGECPVHDELIRQRQVVSEELRSLVVDLGEIWLEKIFFRTTSLFDRGDLFGDDSPLGDLLKKVERMDYKQENLLELVPELGKLKNKLPVSLFENEGSLLPQGEPETSEFQEDIRQILLSGLLAEGKSREN